MPTRHASLLTLVVIVLVAALPAAAEEEVPVETPVYDIVFPVAGAHTYTDTWGDARSGGRTHEGTDIMAEKMVPVVAAADGAVVEVRGFDETGAVIPGSGGQWLIVDHGGWQTWYLHLNNDTAGTDDGLGVGIAPEIVAAHAEAAAAGTDLAFPVEAGSLIGWVGDSGNAEESGSHLHFEIREGASKWEGVAINSYPSLQAASSPDQVTTLVNPWNGTFSDDDGSVHEDNIEVLAAEGVTRGCNPPANTEYCPQRLITRGEIAAFIRRTLALPTSPTDHFTDDGGSVFHDDIESITAAGIGFGCTETTYCPDEPLRRDEMAEMLVRAFAATDPDLYANPDGTDFFTDDDGNPFEDSIDVLMAAGVTKGCNPPDNDRFCPDRPLIRAEMASFFARALGYRSSSPGGTTAGG